MNTETARALAPDDNTLKRAEQLASPRRWIFVERNDRALWGECSGSGADPYRAVVDMNGPAYKCSCPVKRFPCKHALALLLMATDGNDETFGKNPPPQYVTEWIDARDRRTVAKTIPRTEEQIAKSDAGKERNFTERLELMRDGVADLQRRLLDIIRGGLAEMENAPPQYFDDFAARMVDAKLGGLSRQIKSWASLKYRFPESWYERLLSEMGELYLFTKAFQRFEQLSEPLQDEILQQAGMTTKKEDLFSNEGLTDDWLVIAQIQAQEEDNLTSRRVWLMGKNSNKTVLILDFAFGNMGFPNAWVNGLSYRAEVVFYPSAFPLRAAVKTSELGETFTQIIGYQDFTQFLNAYSNAVGQNPWLSAFPALLANVIPVFEKSQFYLVDNDKKRLDTEGVEKTNWQLMALSGGHPISIFGEWNGKSFKPLSVFVDGRLIML